MSEHLSGLAALQHWMQAAVTHRGGIVEDTGVSDIVTRSRALSSAERLSIYYNAYFARLLDCLRELFPALTQLLGEDLFGEFGIAYLTRYPPRSYTLARLTDRFVDFLRETRSDGADAPEMQGWQDLIVDLATVEHTIDEIFDGPGEEESPVSLAARLAAIPPGEWPNLSLRVSASLRLVELSFPLDDLYTALRAGEDDPPLPLAARSHLALWRRDFVVRRLPLSPEQFSLLSHLALGECVADSVAAAAETALDPAQFAAELPGWFERWTAAGLFADLGETPRK